MSAGGVTEGIVGEPRGCGGGWAQAGSGSFTPAAVQAEAVGCPVCSSS